MNALHIGINSSMPIILDLLYEKVIILYNPKYQKLYKEHEKLDNIKSCVKQKCFFKIFKKAKEIKKICKKNDIDLVFTNRKDDMIASKIAFLFKKKRPIILGTFHNPNSWLNDKKVKRFIPIMKFCLDGHLAMSSYAYKKLLFYKYPKNKILFFQNYIPYEDFIQKSNYESSIPFKICYSGTIEPRKNELFALQIVKELNKTNNVIYDVYGPITDEKYKSLLDKFIDENGLQNIVNMQPRLSPDEEKKQMVLHDLYISVSKAEMCPLNILNAKACGMPVAISDSMGQQDLIIDGIDGVKFEEDNLNEAIAKIRKVIDDINFRKKIGINAYRMVSDIKSYKRQALRLSDFIDSL